MSLSVPNFNEDGQLSFRASSVNVANRTVEAIVSTDSPVLMPDYAAGRMVLESLISQMVILAPKIPFLNAHRRESTDDILGSVRDIRFESGKEFDSLVGTIYFASGPEGDKAFNLVREGHATDLSVGYKTLRRDYIPSGQSKILYGRNRVGPLNVAVSWRLSEVSLVPIGADEKAKIRKRFDDYTGSPSASLHSVEFEIQQLIAESAKKAAEAVLKYDEQQKTIVGRFSNLDGTDRQAKFIGAAAKSLEWDFGVVPRGVHPTYALTNAYNAWKCADSAEERLKGANETLRILSYMDANGYQMKA